MNQPMSLERMVATWMADAAASVPSEQLADQIITATAQRRPRPRWLALLQEPPMQAQSRVLVGSPSRRLAFTAILLLIAAIAAAGIGAFLLQQPKPAASDDWPGFRGDAAHSGVVGHGPLGNPVVAWKATLGAPIRNAVAVLGDVAYVADDGGTLTALSVADGSKRWSYAATAPMGGPYATGGVVFVVDGGGVVHALDATSGAQTWASAAKVPQATDGVVSAGLLYYATPDGAVTAFDVQTGAQAWHTNVSPTPITMRAPTVADGLLAAADIHGTISGLDAKTGQVRWTTKALADPAGTPMISGGTVYLGTSADATAGGLVALSASDGRERWHVDRPLAAPSTFGTTGYVVGYDGTFAALDLASGKALWEGRLPEGQMRSPAVAEEALYGYTDNGNLVLALDRATGGLLWTFELDGSNQCCMAMSKGKLFVATDAGTVYVIGGDGAKLAVGPIPQAAPSAIAPTAAPAVSTPTLATPKLAWIADDGPTDFIPWDLAKAPDGRLWAAIGLKDTFAIFGPDGTYQESWGAPGTGKGEFNMRRANGDPYGMVAFAKDGSFYVLDSGNHRVQVFDKDRAFVREWGTLGKGPGQFTETGGIVVDTDGNVVVIDNVRAVIETFKPDGTVVSTIPAFPADLQAVAGVNRGANQIHIGPNGHYFLSIVEPNVLAEIDRSGKLVRTYGSDDQACAIVEQPNGVAWDAAGRMYLGQGAMRGDAPGVMVFGPDGSCLGGFGKLGAGDTDLGFIVGVVVDESGIYISDAGGLPDFGLRSAIRKFEPVAFDN